MTRPLLLGILLLLAISGCSDEKPRTPSPDGSVVFSLINGQKKQLDDYRGTWLLVNFWSVSCPPCFQEMPALTRLHTELKSDNFSIIGIAMPYDRPDMIVETSHREQLSYPVAIDIQGIVTQAFAPITVIPSSYLVNPDGEIVWQHTGVITYDGFLQELAELRSAYKKKG